MARVEPLHAVIVDGVVEQVIVCDAATAEQFRSFDPPVFPGAELVDVTGQGVGVRWAYDDGRFTPPPAPDPVEEPIPDPAPSALVSREEFKQLQEQLDAVTQMILEA